MKTLFIAFGVAVMLINAPNADAKNIRLTGLINADTVCHDGANRGASIGVFLSKGEPPDRNKRADVPPNIFKIKPFLHIRGKGYYSRTTCHDLSDFDLQPGDIIHAWYNVKGDRESSRKYYEGFGLVTYKETRPPYKKTNCKTFRIRYTPRAGEMWVQNAGTTIHNATCVAKDGI